MRLNIGSGDHYQDGWVNIDLSPTVRADLYLDVAEGLPYQDGEVEKIYAGHVLEHLTFGQIAVFLADVRRVLVAGGQLMVVGPDVDRCRATGNVELIERAVHGEHRWPGDEHLWECTEAQVEKLMGDAGMVTVPMSPGYARTFGWPLVGIDGWQCAVLGTNPTE